MIHVLKSTISDNYFYAVESDGEAVLIDPIDANVAIEHIRSRNTTLKAVLNTHFHPDHVGGNDTVLAEFPDAELVSGADAQHIDGVDIVLEDGARYALGANAFGVVETFGHTMGHVTFTWEENGTHLFIGDALFFCGTGHCRYGGEPSTSFKTFRDVLSQFHDDAKFYPGHDYAVRNVEFAASVDSKIDVDAWKTRIEEHNSPVWRLEDDRVVNPFWRFSDPNLQETLKTNHHDVFQEQLQQSNDNDEATFRTLRALRNVW